MSAASAIGITGWGAVSPAGWSAGDLLAAVESEPSLPVDEVLRDGRNMASATRPVPRPMEKLPWLRQPRMRRTSPIARYTVAAAREAIGEDRLACVERGELRLGVIFSLVNGCVNYSRRFFSEVLEDPGLASPIVFPETVFNAPASHLSAMLGAHAINYTMVGDSASFIPGLEIAADWLTSDQADGVVVVGGEELDWLSAEAFQLFQPGAVITEGAGALYLERTDDAQVELAEISGPFSFVRRRTRAQAVESARRAMATCPIGDAQEQAVLFDSQSDLGKYDAPEAATWNDWAGARHSVRRILGNGMGASLPWQCVAAAAWLQGGEGRRHALITAAGTNQQAVAAHFESPVR